jgi:hypothetical protein
VLDTREGAGAFTGTLPADVAASSCGLPTGTEGYVLNATVVPPTSLGYLQFWQYGQPQPALATVLDALDGAITNNMAVVPDTGGWIDAYASNSTQLVLDISGYFAVPAGGGNVSETITTAPTGITLTVDGANYTSPYAFSWVAGSQHTVSVPSTAAPSGTPAGTQYAFSYWSDNGALSHTVYAASTTITASYLTQYYLTTAVSPAGEGTISPGSEWLTAGSAPSISASAYSGYQFLGFSGPLSGTTSPQSLPPINGPESVTANFAPTVTLPPLSINGGSNGAEVAPSTNVSLAFNLYDQANGANDIAWGQFYLEDSSGNAHCYGDWGRPDGLDLYDGGTGTTWGFGINQGDSFCNVSLTSITNSATDPTEATVVLNFNFNPGPGGTYTVLTQINYGSGSGYAGPWEALGTVIVEPAQEPVTSSPVYQSPPESETAPTPPPPASASTTSCDDISGTWTNNAGQGETISIDTSGGIITSDSLATYTTDVCGTITWQLGGSLQPDGTWQVTFSNGSTNSCYVTGAPSTDVVAPGCSSASVTETSGLGTESQTAGTWLDSTSLVSVAPVAPTTTWSRTSTPPGITVTVDLVTGKISTQLAGQKTSNLTVVVSNSQGQQMLSTPHASSQGGSSFSDTFRTRIQGGQQYGSVTATWDTASVTAPVSFFTIGYTHFTQYNTPYHSSCSGTPQPVFVIYKMDSQNCYYQTMMVVPQFASAVNLNGTGVYDSNGTNTVLKAYAAGAKNVCMVGCDTPVRPERQR